MRCLSIARALKEQDAPVRFIVSDAESLELLRERFLAPDEFPVCCLHRDYRRLPEETPALLSCLDGMEASVPRPWLFVDSYFATPDYFAALRPFFRVAYLDDLRSFPCDVDLLIHYDTEDDCACYAHAARKLLGARYTPLRTQFEKPSYTVRPRVQNILLSTGGTDPLGVAEHLLQKIFSAPGTDAPTEDASAFLRACGYHIVTSRANTRYDALLSMQASNPRIHIYEGVSDMASLMASCDLAVSAGGTTLCELCAVGVPTVSYLMADNQRTAVETFAKTGMIPCAGDIRSLPAHHDHGAYPDALSADSAPQLIPSSSVVDKILLFLTSMSADYGARKKSSQSMRAFLDGKGAARIADALLQA